MAKKTECDHSHLIMQPPDNPFRSNQAAVESPSLRKIESKNVGERRSSGDATPLSTDYGNLNSSISHSYSRHTLRAHFDVLFRRFAVTQCNTI